MKAQGFLIRFFTVGFIVLWGLRVYIGLRVWSFGFRVEGS